MEMYDQTHGNSFRSAYGEKGIDGQDSEQSRIARLYVETVEESWPRAIKARHSQDFQTLSP